MKGMKAPVHNGAHGGAAFVLFDDDWSQRKWHTRLDLDGDRPLAAWDFLQYLPLETLSGHPRCHVARLRVVAVHSLTKTAKTAKIKSNSFTASCPHFRHIGLDLA